MNHRQQIDFGMLATAIKSWGRELGFQAVGVSDTNVSAARARLGEWLGAGYHGEMDYMARHASLRGEPAALAPGTIRVISARMDYLTGARDSSEVLGDGRRAFVSRYALGRDYHKVLRGRLRVLARRIEGEIGGFGYRAFTDSAPVMEVELARKSGMGWRGKHTLLLTRDAGSYFFLGEIFTDLPLPVDEPVSEHCGSCTRCLEACPTGAIVAPYKVDARRCISYLTIELKGSIPVGLRALIGNRVYGCDDCQIACPWNRYANTSGEPDFDVRNGLDDVELITLFGWTETEFQNRLAGSAIHRIGYQRWLRNIAVGLGNAPGSPDIISALRSRCTDSSPLVREHVRWALARHVA